MLARFTRSTSIIRSLVFLFLAMWGAPLYAALAPAGKVILTSGPFIAIQSDNSARSLGRGSEFYEGDRLWTGPETRAQIRFSDGALMTLRPDTEFSVDEYEFDDKDRSRNTSLLTLIKGGFRTITGLIGKLRPSAYRVKTAYAIIGIRGTTYETVVDNGLYVAAWQGTISVANNEGEVLLGFGEEYNFATVSSPRSAPTGQLQVPPPLQETVDPTAVLDTTQNRLVASVQDPIAGIAPERLSPTELASLDRSGFAAFAGNGTGSPLLGVANDLTTSGNPIVFDQVADVVLRQAAAPAGAGGTNTSFVGFPVSWGRWDATAANPATIQPDAFDGSVTQDVITTVFWMNLFPAVSVPVTGAVSYDAVLGFSGAGSSGVLAALSMDARVDFASGALNGTMFIDTSPDTWTVSFNGTLLSAQFIATADPGTSTFNTATGVTGRVTGSLTGNASGFGALAPLGMGGVFDFAFGANDVAGTFLARHDARFAPGELASLDRLGFAAFGGTGVTPFSGDANDGAGGTPIIFDQSTAPDVVLRRGTPAATDTVTTDTNLAGFPVSFGEWDGAASPAVSLDDPDGIVSTVNDSVFWTTIVPATSVATATGSVSYNNPLQISGAGSGGQINQPSSSFDATLNFGTGVLNGNMVVTNADTWDVNFTGSLSGAQFSANANSATSTFNAATGVTGTLDGTLTGNASGFGALAPLGLGGVFDFESGANDVAGTFLARHDARFFAGEKATVLASAQSGFAAFGGTGVAPFSGQTTDGAGGSPILFNPTLGGPDGTALRQDGAPAINVGTNTTLGAGFPVSFGEWDGGTSPAALLPDPDGTVNPVSNSVFWTTLLPAVSIPATAAVSYNTVLDFNGSGTGGAVTGLNFDGTLNFGTGALNGNMVVANADTWDVNFSGGISGAQFTATAGAGSTFNGTGVVTGSLTGSLTGNASGFGALAPLGLGGVFDFESGANDVAGTFLARHDGRFLATDPALDRSGFATFGVAAPTFFTASPPNGSASDGAGGQPIFFDQSSDVVLRRGTPTGVDPLPTTDPTFNVSLGQWDTPLNGSAAQLPDANGTVVAVNDPVFWITLPPPGISPTGTLVYNFAGAQITSQGNGSLGSSVSVATIRADINFTSASLVAASPNGMTVTNGSNTWSAAFDAGASTVTGAGFNFVLGSGSAVNASPAQGSVIGSVTGPNAEAIGGAFDFREVSGPDFVQGAFFARP